MTGCVTCGLKTSVPGLGVLREAREGERAADVFDVDLDLVAFLRAGDEDGVFAFLGDAVAFAAGAGDLDLVGFAFLDVRAVGALGTRLPFGDRAERSTGLTAQHLGAVLGDEFRIGEATLRAGDVLGDVGVDGSIELRPGELAVVSRAAILVLAGGTEFLLDRTVDMFGLAVERVADCRQIGQSCKRAVFLGPALPELNTLTPCGRSLLNTGRLFFTLSTVRSSSRVLRFSPPSPI